MSFKKSMIVASIAVVAPLSVIAFHPGIAFAESPLASSLPASSIAQSAQFTVDPAHTSVGFEIGHLGIAQVQGRFNKISGSVEFNAKDLTKSKVSITVLTDSIDTAVAPRDTHLRSADFFDVAKYPEMTFVGTKIVKKGSSYVVTGNLSLHNKTKPVNITFKQYGPIKDPWGNNRIGVVAQPFTIKRSEFGMMYDTKAVSDAVTVRLSMEATQAK